MTAHTEIRVPVLAFLVEVLLLLVVVITVASMPTVGGDDSGLVPSGEPQVAPVPPVVAGPATASSASRP